MSDDNEPTTADWLAAVLPDAVLCGGERYLYAWDRRIIASDLVIERADWRLDIESDAGAASLLCPTRRHVRAICAAFGVPLKETT